jgi:leucyl/phenylalanyl-tRNA---protein transferase
MTSSAPTPRLPWLALGDEFPSLERCWGADSPAPGLLAAGANLNLDTLQKAYGQGIFPWYNEGQPILWWSPDPRMVLHVDEFKLHRSLRKTLIAFLRKPGCEVRIDHDFATTIRSCATMRRGGKMGSWIVQEMQQAYLHMHRAGLAHSIETWMGGQLAGGLYCTALGHAVFGESMFAQQSDASKIALAALVALCKGQGVHLIDCQQQTSHLASLGAREMPRADFCQHVREAAAKKPMQWSAKSVEWKLLDARLAPSDSFTQILPNTLSS